MLTEEKHIMSFITGGKPIAKGQHVLVMIHGRGATAEDIISLAAHLDVSDYSLIAPQATNRTWYPASFLAPPHVNEPWLSSALALLRELVDEVKSQGVSEEHIYFLGFSQGACLALEFVTRNATRFGGVVAFTGGLIGDKINPDNYHGDFKGTPIFIGSSDPDAHVPVERVYATTNMLKMLHAQVTEMIYPGMGHTINEDEINQANRLIFGKRK